MKAFKLKALLFVAATGLTVPAVYTPVQASETDPAAGLKPALTVYKSPTCGCCGNWIKHMQTTGFKIEARDVQDTRPVKARYNIQPAYQSCHTAVYESEDYVFEGHVPGELIQQFIQEPPAGAVGLAVAGMPVGSPGMEYGDAFVPYDVLLIKEDGSTAVYRHVTGPGDKADGLEVNGR